MLRHRRPGCEPLAGHPLALSAPPPAGKAVGTGEWELLCVLQRQGRPCLTRRVGGRPGLVRRWGQKTPQGPRQTQKGPRTQLRRDKNRQFHAWTTEGRGGGPSCSAGPPTPPHPAEPIPPEPPASLEACCWALHSVGAVVTRPGRPQQHPARRAAPEHSGLCHPRNVFDQSLWRGGQSRASNPFPQPQRGAPPPLEPQQARQTIAGHIRGCGPHCSQEDGEENPRPSLR